MDYPREFEMKTMFHNKGWLIWLSWVTITIVLFGGCVLLEVGGASKAVLVTAMIIAVLIFSVFPFMMWLWIENNQQKRGFIPLGTQDVAERLGRKIVATGPEATIKAWDAFYDKTELVYIEETGEFQMWLREAKQVEIDLDITPDIISPSRPYMSDEAADAPK